MSWSARGVWENGTLQVEYQANIDSPESSKQFEVAKEAVGNIVASGALGDSTVDYIFTLSGHANENHQPVAGWSNDLINISVSQLGAAE